jgi:RNA polymerase sigma-70 factor (ECF subfamily)
MATDPFIAELKTGSSQAFKTLVDGHLHKVINICYRFVNNREEAEDLAQETFVEVYESISRFRGDSSGLPSQKEQTKALGILRRRYSA